MIIHNHAQKSPEWFECRKGKLTGSNASTIATAGVGLKTYCHKILADKYALNLEETFQSKAMINGVELEPQARTLFELQTGKVVKEVGFIEYNSYIGASPDGLVEKEKAVVEVKCHENNKHFMLMVYGESEIPKDYLYQVQMEILCAEYEKGYYVAFNPNFKKSLLIFEIQKDEAIQKEILAGCEKGKIIMEQIEEKLLLNN